MNPARDVRLTALLLALFFSVGFVHSNMASGADTAAAPLPPEQLDALVAPIALYPDPLLAQTLAASTYPLEIVQLEQWLKKNPGLKDKALADAVAKQPWDPSVQAMAALPDVVKRLADDIQWTTQLGNAFLAQQADVMDAVQRMRGKAQANGNLKSNEQQTVKTEVVNTETVIVIEQADPQVIYVPAYSPVVVYGPPVYPYPPIYYPPPGYAAVSFTMGVMIGAAWSGGWGWNCGWGGSNVVINVDNHFNRIDHHNRGNTNRGNNNWQHNPLHRGGTPYPDRATSDRFGGGNTRAADRSAGANSTPRASSRDYSSSGSRDSSRTSGAGTRSTDRGSTRSSDSIGSRDLSHSGSGNRGAFGGDGGGYNGNYARSTSSRGAGSTGGRGGGGGGRRR